MARRRRRAVKLGRQPAVARLAAVSGASSSLKGQVAVVTGASRGIGRGTAVALGEKGMVVYLSGRTEADLEETAAAVRKAGGEAHTVLCDHSSDEQTKAIFDRVRKEQGKLQVLVCNAYQQAGKETDRLIDEGKKFQDLPLDLFDRMFLGPRACYSCCYYAAELLRETARSAQEGAASPLVVLMGGFGSVSPAGRPWLSSAYAASKAAVDRLTRDLHTELRTGLGAKGPDAVCLFPGVVETERVQEMRAEDSSEMERMSGGKDAENSLLESPVLIGRVAAAIASDPALRKAPIVDGPGIHDRTVVVSAAARSLDIQDGGAPGSAAEALYGPLRPAPPPINSLGYLGPTLIKPMLPEPLQWLAEPGGPLASPDLQIPLLQMSQGDVADK